MIFQDVETDAAVRVDVTVVNSGCELHLRRLEGVVGGEGNAQEKDASGVRGVIWTHDGGLPCELVLLIEGPSRTTGGRDFAKINEFFLDALESHIQFIRKIEL